MAGQIIERGEKTFLLRVYQGREDGKRIYRNETFHGTRREAEARLRSLLHKKDEGALPKPTRWTLAEYLTHWLEHSVKNGTRNRTYEDYRYRTEKYITPFIGRVKLADLSTTHVKWLYNELKSHGLAARSIRYAHAVLHRALEDAVHDRLIAFNPAKAARKSVPATQRREMRTFDNRDALRFLGAARSDKLYPLFLVLLYGGLRPNEAFALKWSDLEGTTLRVQRALTRPSGGGWKLEAPKTKRASRPVPLPGFVAVALKHHRKRQLEERMGAGEEWQDNDLIFTGAHGEPLHHSNVVRRHYKPILKRAKLPELRLYDLRHSMASLLLAANTHPKVVQERLGHQSIALTLDTYSHLIPGMQERATEQLEALVPDTFPMPGESGSS